jgi:hypothetical protein
MSELLGCDGGAGAWNMLSLGRDLRRMESSFVFLPRLFLLPRKSAQLRSVWHLESSRPMCFNRYRPDVRGRLGSQS